MMTLNCVTKCQKHSKDARNERIIPGVSAGVLEIPDNCDHDEDVAHCAEQRDDAVQHEEGDLHLGQEDQKLVRAQAGVVQGGAVHVFLKLYYG